MTRRASILVAVLMWVAGGNLRATEVGLIKIKGVILPATADYITRAITIATERRAECLIIQLDTPGGLLHSTYDIRDAFYNSKVPVVVFVGPRGAAATSAGTFITMAADVAAMAPHTRIGAAHPVGYSGDNDTNSIMSAKAENDTAMAIKNIAETRGRNAEWAQDAVRKSVSITSEEALDLNVVDIIADDLPALLEELDGREVGKKTLATAKATVFEIEQTVSEKFLQMALQPGVMFFLMLMVMYGIIGEITSPGAILPGVVGSIALILVLYMSSVLPVNVAGVALMIVAVVLFIAEFFVVSHGILTIGGIVAFFLGALFLFDRSNPAFRLSLGYIIPATVVTALFFIFIVGAGLRAQYGKTRSGTSTMLGQIVNAMSRIDAAGGNVLIEGELWRAVSEVPVENGQAVEVVGIEGLTLKVKPKS